MIGIFVFLLGTLIAVAHNTTGDIVAGVMLAALGIALWASPSANRIRH